MECIWFRQDLRISDNEALAEASRTGMVLPIYIFDDCAPHDFKLGGIAKTWLQDSLNKLNKSLGNNLNLYTGNTALIIEDLIKRYNIKNIFYNTCYEPWGIDQENSVKEICKRTSTGIKAFNSNYLYLPTQVLKADGSYYKVFTAYKNKAHSIVSRKVIANRKKTVFFKDQTDNITIQNTWNTWNTGESPAKNKLRTFIKNHLNGYKINRNYPSKNSVSKLSPHLHFGEISPAQIMEMIRNIGPLYANESDIECFINEIMWREFSCYLLYHFQNLPINNFNSKFNTFRWKNNPNFLQVWKDGKTGYPLIDAGMRELKQTGYMHNRVRMIAASFLIKNLNIHWHQGMNWFWECLLDADLANNSANWQWVAGSGADAAPYFRIFNPTIQGEKFDTNGEYTKRFVPELKNMPNKYLFKPWAAPNHILKAAGVSLGITYPKPIIDFSASRKKALERYKIL